MNRYAPFYASFGLSCAKSIDATSDICYCLKRQNNAYFDAAILRGNLELGDTVLILPLRLRLPLRLPLLLPLRLPLSLTLTPTLIQARAAAASRGPTTTCSSRARSRTP